jgi:hypothetical protein
MGRLIRLLSALSVGGVLAGCSSTPSPSATTRVGSPTQLGPAGASTIVQAAVALDTFVAAQATEENQAAVAAHQPTPFMSAHSSPVTDGNSIVALLAFSYDPGGLPVKVLTFTRAHWSVTASLPPPIDPGTSASSANRLSLSVSTVPSADVTGDGQPDFLVLLAAADNSPGAVVSQDGSTRSWRYLTFASAAATEVIGRNPMFQGDRLVSEKDNCVPDCARGKTTVLDWSYDTANGEFESRPG